MSLYRRDQSWGCYETFVRGAQIPRDLCTHACNAQRRAHRGALLFCPVSPTRPMFPHSLLCAMPRSNCTLWRHCRRRRRCNSASWSLAACGRLEVLDASQRLCVACWWHSGRAYDRFSLHRYNVRRTQSGRIPCDTIWVIKVTSRNAQYELYSIFRML